MTLIGGHYQGLIDAQQLVDDIVYAQRSCKAREKYDATHVAQIKRGCAAAAILLDTAAENIEHGAREHKLREALKLGRECVRESRQVLKDFGAGGKRQLRLALADESGQDRHVEARRLSMLAPFTDELAIAA